MSHEEITVNEGVIRELYRSRSIPASGIVGEFQPDGKNLGEEGKQQVRVND